MQKMVKHDFIYKMKAKEKISVKQKGEKQLKLNKTKLWIVRIFWREIALSQSVSKSFVAMKIFFLLFQNHFSVDIQRKVKSNK